MADDFNDSFDGSSVEEFSSDSYTDFSSEETYEQSSDAFISDYDDTISATDYETTEDDSGLEENDYDDSYNDYVSEEEQEEEYIVDDDDFEETVTEPSADPEDAFISELDEAIQEEDEGLSDEESELYLEEDEEEPQEVEPQEEIQDEYLADEDDEQIAESEETDPDASGFVVDTDNIQPQYGTLAEYLNGHNYGQEDYDVYSQDPEWRRLYSIEYPDAELPPLTSESIDNILAPYEGKTYDSLGEYLSDHNFGQADYEIYSQDPEWRRLYYEQYPDATLPPLSQERIDAILAPYEGRTYDTVEDYLNDHNFGQGDYEIYSQDPEYIRLINASDEEQIVQEQYPLTETEDISDRVVDGNVDFTDDEMMQIRVPDDDYVSQGITDRPIDFSDANLNETLGEFTPDNWDNMELDEQKNALSRFADSVMDTIGFENPPEIKYYYDDDPDASYGEYNPNTNTVNVNEYFLNVTNEEAGVIASNEAVDTIAHELWHAHQNECAENPQSLRDYQYRFNLEGDNYITSSWNHKLYESQLVEAEARAFAQQYKDYLNL